MKGTIISSTVLGAMMGVFAGVGSYTFLYAKGASYLTDDPRACANCHIMQDHYDAWIKSSHAHVAMCNDCHTPDGLISKYVTKAENGYHHSVAFTTGWFDEPLQIKEKNRAIAEASCRKCHADIVQSIDTFHFEARGMSCIRCHDSVGHMR